ncbi:MAG: acyl carrier protein [Solirubrobacteraceae bacterium]|nr:acyl carrier protein [Solirubrobacteraceae bacterium]
MNVTAEAVRAVVLDELAPALADSGRASEGVADDLDLIDAGLIDSLGMLEIIAAVEARFAIEVDFEELEPERLRAIGPFSRFIAEQA